MCPFKFGYFNKQEGKKHRKKGQRSQSCFFSRYFIFLMTAEKNKSTDLSSFSLLMVGEAYEMWGWIRNENSKKDEELNKWKQVEGQKERERETDQRSV